MKRHWIQTEGHDDMESMIMNLVIELDSPVTVINFDNEGEPDAVKAVMTKYDNGARGVELYEVQEIPVTILSKEKRMGCIIEHDPQPDANGKVGNTGYSCPRCGSWLGNDLSNKKYCHNCGQCVVAKHKELKHL